MKPNVLPKAIPPEPISVKPNPIRVEFFYRLRAMPGTLVMYAAEEIRVEDDRVVNRRIVTERDTREMTLSKIMGYLEKAPR